MEVRRVAEGKPYIINDPEKARAAISQCVLHVPFDSSKLTRTAPMSF